MARTRDVDIRRWDAALQPLSFPISSAARSRESEGRQSKRSVLAHRLPGVVLLSFRGGGARAGEGPTRAQNCLGPGGRSCSTDPGPGRTLCWCILRCWRRQSRPRQLELPPWHRSRWTAPQTRDGDGQRAAARRSPGHEPAARQGWLLPGRSAASMARPRSCERTAFG